jgi:Flp pilus assembly protein TadG
VEPFVSMWRDRRGSSVTEFALVLPVFLFLTLGAIYLSVLMYAMSNLHQATEAAARWASIQVTVSGTPPTPPTPTTVTTYAASRYTGPNVSATFTYANVSTPTAANCGNLVTASGSFRLLTGLSTLTVPVGAQACFP